MLRTLALAVFTLPLVRCCTEQRDKGFTCDTGSSSMRFYHDSKSGRCQPFFFLGCGGNGNNFADKQACEGSCLSPSTSKSLSPGNPTNSAVIMTACSLTTSAVLQDKAVACRSPSNCAAGHTCSNGSCCPTKDHICSLTPDNGNEATEFVHRGRYAWIPSLKNCIRQAGIFICLNRLFSYFGVNGNANNFPSYKDCVAFCGAQ